MTENISNEEVSICPFCRVPVEATLTGLEDGRERCERCDMVWQIFHQVNLGRVMAKVMVAHHIGQDRQRMQEIVDIAERLIRGDYGR